MEQLGPLEGDALLARLEKHLPDAVAALRSVYAPTRSMDVLVGDLLDIVGRAAAGRPDGCGGSTAAARSTPSGSRARP